MSQIQIVSPVKKVVGYLRSIARVTLRSYLLKSHKLLLFGYYPGVGLEFTSKSDATYNELKVALSRCRAFPGDLKVFLEVEHEAHYLPYLTSKDKISLDIGANVGFYSALLAPRSHRVFSYEANPNLYPYLMNNLYKYKNVSIMPFAVAQKSGEISFNVPFDKAGDALSISGQGGTLGLFMAKTGVLSLSVTVPTISVDTLALDHVGFLKIDVEGAEFDVLESAAATIKRCRPNIVIENEYRHNPDCAKVFEFMQNQNYQGYFVDRPTKTLRHLSEFSLEKNQIQLLTPEHAVTDTNNYVFNFMFVPAEADTLKHLLAKPLVKIKL